MSNNKRKCCEIKNCDESLKNKFIKILIDDIRKKIKLINSNWNNYQMDKCYNSIIRYKK